MRNWGCTCITVAKSFATSESTLWIIWITDELFLVDTYFSSKTIITFSRTVSGTDVRVSHMQQLKTLRLNRLHTVPSYLDYHWCGDYNCPPQPSHCFLHSTVSNHDYVDLHDHKQEKDSVLTCMWSTSCHYQWQGNALHDAYLVCPKVGWSSSTLHTQLQTHPPTTTLICLQNCVRYNGKLRQVYMHLMKLTPITELFQCMFCM